MQAMLDAITGENQSAAVEKKILHTSSTIQQVTDVSHKLNSNLA